MKSKLKYFAAVLAALSLVSLTACGSGTANNDDSSAAENVSASGENTTAAGAAEITAKIQEDVKFPSMADISERITDYYDIDTAKVESVSAFICGSGAAPDEIAVFKMASADDASAAKSVLEERVEKQKTSFEDYKPDEMYKFDSSNVVVKGQYAAVIITADNSTAVSIFNNMAQ